MYEKLYAMQEETLKVIANQKRLEIIQLLEHGDFNVSEMVEMLGIRQSNLSQHLAILRQGGIVTTKRKGHNVTYCLSDVRYAEATKLIRTVLYENHKFDERIKLLLDAGPELYPVTTDPVCNMRISVSQAEGAVEFDGTTYYFCASDCKISFELNPNNYVNEVKSI